MTLKPQQTAPDFELLDQSGTLHRLGDYRGQRVLLYFYPQDDTPGCTKEACNFRDDYSAYQDEDVVILGVSPDNAETHSKFSEKYQLPFPLLADPEHLVCKQYGVWGVKEISGKEYKGVYRTTYLIDRQGKIEKVFEQVKPDEHSAEVLELLQAS